MSGTPLARPDAWRLWWSFTWRQALVMVLATVAVSIVLAVLKWLGVPPRLLVDVLPYLTFGIVLYSGFEACRYLQSAYDIRLHGAHHHDEQNHRHRR